MTVFLGARHGECRVQDNDRFDWSVLDQIFSCYCCLAVNWQASVFAYLTVRYSLVVVSSCFLFSLLAVVLYCLSSYSAVPGNILITAMADAQITGFNPDRVAAVRCIKIQLLRGASASV